MTIIDKIIEVNKYNRPCKYSKPITICIHYTGQAKTGADRLAQRRRNRKKQQIPYGKIQHRRLIQYGKNNHRHRNSRHGA